MASPIPVLVKKSVVMISVTVTIETTKRSKEVNGKTLPATVNPSCFAGAGNPRSSAAQIIPASACSTPRIPSDAITGTAARIDSLLNSSLCFLFDSGRITKISSSAPSAAPEMSATKKAIQ